MKKHSRLPLIIFIFVLVLALCAAVWYMGEIGINIPFLSFAKVNKFEKALNENNYQAAATVLIESQNKDAELESLKNHLNAYFALCFSAEYNDDTWKKYRGIEVFNEYIKDDVINELNNTVSRFYSGEFDETNAKIFLSRIGKFSFAKRNLADCIDEVEYKQESDKAYSAASELISNGEYADAIRTLKKVSKSDTAKYSAAEEAIRNCKNIYLPKKTAEAEELLAQGDRKGAENIVDELISLFPDDESVKELQIKISGNA